MLGLNLSKLIEKHCDELSDGLVERLYRSERTKAFRTIPRGDLRSYTHNLFSNLTEWLVNKSDEEISADFISAGGRRHEQGVPMSELTWALLLSKDHLWRFLQSEHVVDGALQLFGTLEFLRQLDFFFERAIYYASIGHEQVTRAASNAA
jgi:hypothetical protein